MFLLNEEKNYKLRMINKYVTNILDFSSKKGLIHVAVNASSVPQDQVLNFYFCNVPVIRLILN